MYYYHRWQYNIIILLNSYIIIILYLVSPSKWLFDKTDSWLWNFSIHFVKIYIHFMKFLINSLSGKKLFPFHELNNFFMKWTISSRNRQFCQKWNIYPKKWIIWPENEQLDLRNWQTCQKKDQFNRKMIIVRQT